MRLPALAAGLAAAATLFVSVTAFALPAAAASQNTARATGNLPIRTGPGSGYAVIGTLKSGSRVHLERCTRESNWCLFVDDDGDAVGWVRGSYLVGSAAKLEVTPQKFLGFDIMDPLGNGRWPHLPHP